MQVVFMILQPIFLGNVTNYFVIVNPTHHETVLAYIYALGLRE